MGKPTRLQIKKQELTQEQKENTGGLDLNVYGRTGLKYAGGFIIEEFHRALVGTQGIKVYREMQDNDAVIGGVLYAIKTLIRQVDWRIEPSGDSPQAQEQADFVQGCLDDMSHTFEDFITEILSFLPYGWSYFELVYKRRGGDTDDPTTRSQYDDGKIGWRKIDIRSQDSLQRWEIDEAGGIQGMWQASAPRYELLFIPIEKALLFRTERTKNNPEGRSILRNAYRSWYFLKRIQETEAIGIQRDLVGLPVLQVPPEIMSPTASAEQQSLRGQLEQLIQEIHRDEREGVVIPSELDQDGKPTGFKLGLLSTGGQRQLDIDAIVRRYEQRIAASVLAEFILLGMDGIGSFALASSKTDMFGLAIGAIMDQITATFNRFAISRLMDINSVPRELWPTLVHGDVESPPLDELGTFINSMASAGVIKPDAALERKIREMANLPEPEEPTEPIVAAPVTPPVETPGQTPVEEQEVPDAGP